MALLEWEKHVTKCGGKNQEHHVSWCGVDLYSWGWAFLDAEHARESEARGSRLKVCPACKEAIERAYKPPPTGDPED